MVGFHVSLFLPLFLQHSPVTLGYARTQHLFLDEELIRDWQENHLYFHRDTVTIEGDLVRDILPANYEAFHAYLDRKLLPLRTVTLHPFLIETVAQEADQQLPSPLLTSFRRKVDRPQPGYLKYVTHGKHHPTPQRHVVAFLKTQGFRLPSSDEWEYACAAGSRALFHWGNWMFEAGGMEQIPAWGEYLPVGKNSDWVNDDLRSGAKHPRSNAFGLQIANHSHHYEYCAEPTIMRGGDGGAGVYGGTLAEALSLAFAFSVQLEANEVNNGAYHPYFRRVYDLGNAV